MKTNTEIKDDAKLSKEIREKMRANREIQKIKEEKDT
jgi:hypothetical protein